MAPASREDRRLMRQRGAGTRMVNNIDFDLAFPTPTQARRSKTPQETRQTSKRSSKTPARRPESQEPAALQSIPRTQNSDRNTKRKSVYVDAEIAETTSAPGKRRKLSNAASDATPAAQSTNGAVVTNSDSTFSRPRRSTARRQSLANVQTIIPIAEEEDGRDANPSATGLINSANEAGPGDNGVGKDVEGDKENSMPGAEKPKAKRTKRKSIVLSGRKKKRSSTGSLPESSKLRGTGIVHDGQNGQEQSPIPQIHTDIVSSRNQKRQDLNVDHLASSEQPPDQLLQKQAREGSAVSARPAGPLSRSSADEDDRFEKESTATSVQGDRRRRKPKKRKSIGQKRKPHKRVSQHVDQSPRPPPQYDLEHDAGEDETYIDEEHSPEPPTPALTSKKAQRKMKANKQTLASRRSKSTSAPPSSRPGKSTFPITTHRLTNISLLPTINEESEAVADLSNDEATTSHQHHHFGTDRHTPNAVDVLAQICQEIISKTLTAATATATAASAAPSTSSSSTNTAATNTTTTTTTSGNRPKLGPALTSFATALDTRLFDMSAAVENRLTLEARVKRAQREKTETQGRWMAVRKQREDVALRLDAVRRRHWDGEARAERDWRLSETVAGLEDCLHRGGSRDTGSHGDGDGGGDEDDGKEGEIGVGLEFLLESVGGSAVGVLDTVKGFNAQLERLAAVLEGRLDG